MNKRSRKYTLIHNAAMLAMGMYFLITIGYLFFAPKFQHLHASPKTKFKPNTLLIYSLIRTNRCMANDKPDKMRAKLLISPASPVFFKSGKIPPLIAGNNYCLSPLTLIDHHFSYLSNRVLRI